MERKQKHEKIKKMVEYALEKSTNHQLVKDSELYLNVITSPYNYGLFDSNSHGDELYRLHFNVSSSFLDSYNQSPENIRQIEADLTKILSDNVYQKGIYLEVAINVDYDSPNEDWRSPLNSYIEYNKKVKDKVPNIVLKIPNEEDLKRIWIDKDNIRLFLSHKAEFKKETTEIKNILRTVGISSFVAHEDIKPSKEWLLEIQKALMSCDAVIPILTKDFKHSDWTDQEIGIAIGLGKPVFPIKFEIDPYGFFGGIQALAATQQNLFKTSEDLINTILSEKNLTISTKLLKRIENIAHTVDIWEFINERLKFLPKEKLSHKKDIDNLIKNLELSQNFDQANKTSNALIKYTDFLTKKQKMKMKEISTTNSQVESCWDFEKVIKRIPDWDSLD